MKQKFGTIVAGVCVLIVGLALWVSLRTLKPAQNSSVNGGSLAASTNSSVMADWRSSPTGASLLERTAFDLQEGNLISPRKPFYFGLDRVPLLQRQIFGDAGQPLWEILASLLYVVMTFYIAKFLDFFINAKLKKWAARTETKLDDLLLDLLHGPTTLLTFVILLHYGLHLSTLFSVALKVLVAISLTYLCVKAADISVAYWKHRAATGGVDKAFDDMLVPVISKSLKAFIILVAILVTSDNLGFNIKSVLASLSVGGLALGLAAQDTLANIFGAVSVFVDKPFRIGDRIKLDQVDGSVESIGLRSTRVRNLEGYLVTIPNKIMGNAIITNVSRRPTIKTELNLGLTYDTSVEKLKRALMIIEQVYNQHPLTQEALIAFNNFGDSSLNVNVVHYCKTSVWKDYLAALQELNLTLKQRFDEEGIEMAFPSRMVYVKTVSDSSAPQSSILPC